MKKWTPMKIAGLCIAILSLLLLLISIFWEEKSSTFLAMGLLCSCIGAILFQIEYRKRKQ